MKSILEPYRKLADVIESSGLDYTILRPDWFTDAEEVSDELTRKPGPEKGKAVSGKSIASFIGTIIHTPGKYICENFGLAKPD